MMRNPDYWVTFRIDIGVTQAEVDAAMAGTTDVTSETEGAFIAARETIHSAPAFDTVEQIQDRLEEDMVTEAAEAPTTDGAPDAAAANGPDEEGG